MKTIEINIKKNEEKIIPYIWINGEEKEVELVVQMSGEGGIVHIVGIFLGKENHSITFNTKVIHKGLHTKSLTTIRGVFFDRSVFKNDGLITIAKGAKGADGYFTSKVLLFDHAKGRSVPSLEIDENDLKAGHASTIGRPDQQQLFYLRSRGLTEDEASRLIVTGFFEPVIKLLSKNDQKKVQQQIDHFLLRHSREE